MPTTWHWGERGSLAHAKVHSELPKSVALCGDPVETAPMMRPPLMAVRCSTCELLRWDESEWFINKFHHRAIAGDALDLDIQCEDLPTELNYRRLDFTVQRMVDRDGFVPFIQIVRSESDRWHEVLFNPMGLMVTPTESLAVDYGSILVWEYLDQFPAHCDVLD